MSTFRFSQRRSQRRGMALLAVIMLLSLMSFAVAITLERTASSVRDSGIVRSTEMLKGGMEIGFAQASDRIQETDIAGLLDVDYDIFYSAGAPVDFVPTFAYPTVGPTANDYAVRVGLRLGQRGRAVSGEDATKSHGQIVEVEVQIATNPLDPEGARLVPAEERAVVGLLIPRANSHSN